MPSKKLGRTNEDIRLVLSDLIREVKDPRIRQGLISVTAVDTTSDLKYCKVYLSVLGLSDEKGFMRGIRSASGWFRRELGHRLSLRNTPELTFQLDRSMEYGAHISQLISGLDLPEETEDSDNEENIDG